MMTKISSSICTTISPTFTFRAEPAAHGNTALGIRAYLEDLTAYSVKYGLPICYRAAFLGHYNPSENNLTMYFYEDDLWRDEIAYAVFN